MAARAVRVVQGGAALGCLDVAVEFSGRDRFDDADTKEYERRSKKPAPGRLKKLAPEVVLVV